MIWQAVLKSGKVINEYELGNEFNFKSLPLDEVVSFKLVESGRDEVIKFSGDTGLVQFNNLDLTKLQDLVNGQELKLVYDEERQNFKMSPESLKLYSNLTINESNKYNYIELQQDGAFNINGDIFHMGVEVDGEIIIFLNQGPYTDIIHYKDGMTDFIGTKKSPQPYKRIDAVLNYVIGYNAIHKYNDWQFNLSYKLLFNTINRTVSADVTLITNKVFTGNVCLFYGNNQSKLNATIMPNQPANLNRILTLV